MDLNRIAIVPRIRNNWEAIDLGFILARHWYWPLLVSWLIPMLIMYAVWTYVFYEKPFLAILAIWWFKPMWDRLPLYIASRRLFGESLSLGAFLGSLKSVFAKDWLMWLTLRRFSFTRSFDMPVTVLESLTGSDRDKRLAVLHQKAGSTASWLTFVCIHLETVIGFGIVGMIYLFIPSEVNADFFQLWLDDNLIVQHAENFLFITGMVLIAPFYTMAGFSLYINRRIELEAWDIEIRFRHLAQQFSERERQDSSLAVGKGSSVSVLSILTLSLVLAVGETEAAPAEPLEVQQPEAQDIYTSHHAKTDIDEILAGESFHKIEEKSGWRRKNQTEVEQSDEIPDWLIAFVEWLERWFSTNGTNESNIDIAQVLEFLLWVFVIAVVVYVVYRYRDVLREVFSQVQNEKQTSPPPVEELFGLSVKKETIPKNVPEQVLSLWGEGKHRMAMGLLYRATLSHLVHDFSFQLDESYTEQECANIVNESDNRTLAHFMNTLTNSWQRYAYGHLLPHDDEIDAFCGQWREIFDEQN